MLGLNNASATSATTPIERPRSQPIAFFSTRSGRSDNRMIASTNSHFGSFPQLWYVA